MNERHPYIPIPAFAEMLGITRQHALKLAKRDCPPPKRRYPRPKPKEVKLLRMEVREDWAREYVTQYKQGENHAIGAGKK